MGRILEALMHGGRRCPSGTRADIPRLAPADMAPAPPEAGEIPFIEVGGPGAAVEGSAQVLAASRRPPGPPAPVKASVGARGYPESPLASAEVAPAPADPLAVAFQPANSPPPPFSPAGQRFAPQLVAFHQPDHPVSAQYRALLNGLKGQLRTEGSQVLGLMAPASGTGTTTVLLNLAMTQARQGDQRVVVVDANLRRPAVAQRLGLLPAPGVREVVARSVALKRALQPTGQSQCWALTAGEPLAAGSSWPSGDALRALLDQLRQQFDWVLLDAPSWEGGAEMVALGAACDAVFLVLRPGDVDTPTVREIGRLIPPLGSSLGGYILAER